MVYKKAYILFFLFCLGLTAGLKAQNAIYYEAGTSAIASSGETAPFWLHSNKYGMYSASPYSSTTHLTIGKDFRQDKKLFKYAFKANGQFRADEAGGKFYFQELYAKLRLSVFDLTIGAREEHFGNQDPILSSGGFLYSGNSRPMPKIAVGIEEFTTIPYTRSFIEVKGGLSHGWFNENRYIENALLHHKYAYIRLGGNLPVNFQYGLEHAAQWGGTHPDYGKQAIGFDDFMRVFFGKGGGENSNPNEQNNTLGNHIISQSMRLDIKLSGFTISGYWQNLNEDPPIRPIWNSMNIPDGLWGVSIRQSKIPFVSGLLYEYLNTTDQSGPYHDKDGIIYGGNDDYFANYIYKSGWTYRGRIIGTPFITPPYKDQNNNLIAYNNRVKVHHFGLNGDIFGFQYRALASFSKSFGTNKVPFAEPMESTSLLLEVNKPFPKLFNLEFGCSIATDRGKMPAIDQNVIKNGGNTFGACITVKKRGTIFKW